MKPERLDVVERQIIFERQAFLRQILIVRTAARIEYSIALIISELESRCCGARIAVRNIPLSREIKIHRTGIILRLQIIYGCLVQEAIPLELVSQLKGLGLAIDGVRTREGVGPISEVPDIFFFAIRTAQVQPLLIIDRPGQLTKDQILLERSFKSSELILK